MSSAAAAAPDRDQALRALLEAGLVRLGTVLKGAQIHRLTRYLRLLEKWNHVYNLTGVRDVRHMVSAHVLDSLSVCNFIHGPSALDVGSGAGLPGIPLAIACPRLQFVLLDSNAKKIRFVQQAIIELRLSNVDVERRRVETYRPAAGFDTVMSRAFASLEAFIARAEPLCAPSGRMLAMKSGLSAAEQELLGTMPERIKTYKLKVPHLDRERQLIEIRKA
ncbi:MAG: 16S rRNA (guanine(527)-N(7))-methyltransferase RsmG [Gammaproteobacteria bacterium]